MVGLAFAIDLSQKKNCSIAIVEPNNINPSISKMFHTRVSAITPSSEAYLKSLNIWEDIQRKQVFVTTKVWDQNSHGRLNFHAKDENMDHLGYIIENDLIQSALFGGIDKNKIECINAKLIGLNKTEAGYEVNLDNEVSFSCRLLVGADGANSLVRTLSAIEVTEHNYVQKAIIANIIGEKPFQKTTWQRFLSDSIIALLPLSENQASIVWSCKNNLADELTKLDHDKFNQSLSEAVEYRFGNLELKSDRQVFPLIERSAKDYTKPNLALIGDAAHNIHPLAGQGVNLGFSDAKELNLQLLANSDKTLGDHSVLRKYARARRLDNELMAKTMTGLDWIYKENNEPLRWLRGLGMNVIDETPILKSFFQKQALGKLE